jgi:phi13 family phage major tail protein
MNNKVQYGLKNVHYAIIKNMVNQKEIYDKPKPLPYAVSLTLSPAGDVSEAFADNNTVYFEENNNGYTGTLEMTIIGDDFKKDVLGEIDLNGVIYENSIINNNEFALLFQFEGDANAKRFVCFRCKCGRVNISSKTTTKTKDFQNSILDIIILPALSNNDVRASIEEKLNTGEIYKDWFNKVYTREIIENLEINKSIIENIEDIKARNIINEELTF